MSYSRWSDSLWYTFWQCTESDLREEQKFCVDCVCYFSYEELLEDLESCLTKAVEKSGKNPTKQQVDELRNYMQLFIKDVEHYHWKTRDWEARLEKEFNTLPTAEQTAMVLKYGSKVDWYVAERTPSGEYEEYGV